MAEQGVSLRGAARAELSQRLASAPEVIDLIFNEGYAATAGDDWNAADVPGSAALGRILAGAAPAEPDSSWPRGADGESRLALGRADQTHGSRCRWIRTAHAGPASSVVAGLPLRVPRNAFAIRVAAEAATLCKRRSPPAMQEPVQAPRPLGTHRRAVRGTGRMCALAGCPAQWRSRAGDVKGPAAGLAGSRGSPRSFSSRPTTSSSVPGDPQQAGRLERPAQSSSAPPPRARTCSEASAIAPQPPYRAGTL